ncbi:lactonase family protein [Paenibacillus puldeungensis]|uniref:Lactonase family protein n=1 Tax=Paenibacillus puldeungensis TaxID=696536 RepID=A0ABW3RT77_9BACL
MSLQKESGTWSFFVGSYAQSDKPGIYLCELDRQSGKLRIRLDMDGIVNPSFIVVDKEAGRLYAVSEQENGGVASYAIDPANGKLSILSEMPTLGSNPCHLAVLHGVEGHLLVANYTSAHVNSFELSENGVLAEMKGIVQHKGSGLWPDRQEAAHAHSIIPSRSGKYAYVSDLGIDQIITYRLQEGRFVKHGEVKLPAGSGPRHFVIHPSERFAYGINELNNTMTLYSYDPAEGALEIKEHYSTLPEGFKGENYPADIHFSTDGRFVYGSNRGHNSLVQFTIDPETGRLDDPKWIGTGGSWPRNFAVFEDYVIVANQFGNNLVAFHRDDETGMLSSTGHQLAISQPSCIEPYI